MSVCDVDADGARLTVLATEIKAKLTLARRHGQATLSALMDVGDRLTEARKALAHGQWDDWLSDNFELSDRTARLYMQLAGHRVRIEAKMATVATLGIRGALEQISEDQKAESREQRIALAREAAVKQVRRVIDAYFARHRSRMMRGALRNLACQMCDESAAEVVAYLTVGKRAELHADAVAIITWLEELLRLLSGPPVRIV
jgi:hypothetical protein